MDLFFLFWFSFFQTSRSHGITLYSINCNLNDEWVNGLEWKLLAEMRSKWIEWNDEIAMRTIPHWTALCISSAFGMPCTRMNCCSIPMGMKVMIHSSTYGLTQRRQRVVWGFYLNKIPQSQENIHLVWSNGNGK